MSSRNNEQISRWWDELNACIVLRGGSKRDIARYPGAERLLMDCVKNNIYIKFSLPEVLHRLNLNYKEEEICGE